MLNFLKKKNIPNIEVGHSPKEVGDFYNQYHKEFLQVYGNVIQAFRTTDVSKLLNYEMQSMEMKSGMQILDAGCGVCGPACYFAQKNEVQIEAITISEKQFELAKHEIQHQALQEKIKVKLGDYHRVDEFYPLSHFDLVYFLESFGHSGDKELLLRSMWNVLKPGGVVYIKDLFLKEAVLEKHKEKIDQQVQRINEAYKYQVADLYDLVKIARKMGFILCFVKTIDIAVNDFENLTISNDFQMLTGIAAIDNWEEYIFPVDFFELKLMKPHTDLSEGLNKYFLQNMYYMQVNANKNHGS